jgi:hypothetical protein
LAACAGGDNDDGVATLGNGDQAGAATASPSIDPEDALAEFAKCMRCPRGRGLPRPQVDEDAGIEIGEGGADGVPHRDGPRGDRRGYGALSGSPAAGWSRARSHPEDQAAFQDSAIEYAECMREHGVEDFPDPGFAADGAFIQRIDPGIANSDEFRGADEACQSIIEDAHPGGEEGGR